MLSHRLLLFVLSLLMSVMVLPASAIDETISDIPGNIALIGADFNVYTYNFDTQNLSALTNDASRMRRYQWPTWAPDGRLAYFCCDLRGASAFETQAFISPDGIASGALSYRGVGESVIYAAWAPATCGSGCRDLAMLINNVQSGALGIEMLRDSGSTSNSARIAAGAPFYYHWDASGTQLVFHRNNRTIDIYNRDQDDISDSYAISSGSFQAPAWSPVDGRILVAAEGASARLTDLVIIEDNETRVLVSDLNGFVGFQWSPDGRYVAYRSFTQNSVGQVYVADSRTGEIVSSSDASGVIAFFWSPDSSKLAYVTPQSGRNQSASTERMQPIQDDSPPQFVWSVLDVEQGRNVRYSSFIPTYETGYFLIYFDQFAPSHRIWSPDSRYFVYATLEQRENDVSALIQIQDTVDDNLQAVSEGVLGIWSFE